MFGMGTGGSLRLLSPEILGYDLKTLSLVSHTFKTAQELTLSQVSTFFTLALSCFALSQWLALLDQALDLLVSASYIRYRTSTADLSTSSSLRGLTNLRCGSLILQGGFTLRCLQRLSRPHFASLLCPWQNNSFTRGASIPVLSY